MYYNTYQSALRRADGKTSEADYIMNCGYFEFYERILHGIDYGKWVAEQMKQK